PGERHDPGGLAAARDLLGQEAEARLHTHRVLERPLEPGRVSDLTAPQPEPQRREHPVVSARVGVAGVARNAVLDIAELSLERRDSRTHLFAARVHCRKGPGEAKQGDVDDRIAERTEIAAVEVAPELALDRLADDLRRRFVRAVWVR